MKPMTNRFKEETRLRFFLSLFFVLLVVAILVIVVPIAAAVLVAAAVAVIAALLAAPVVGHTFPNEWSSWILPPLLVVVFFSIV